MSSKEDQLFIVFFMAEIKEYQMKVVGNSFRANRTLSIYTGCGAPSCRILPKKFLPKFKRRLIYFMEEKPLEDN